MKLSVRYTMSQLNDMGELSGSQIRAQLARFGFDMNAPITKKVDIDSVYYQQGEGQIKIPEPVTLNSSEEHAKVKRTGRVKY